MTLADMTPPSGLSPSGQHITVPLFRDALTLVQRIDLLVDVRRHASRPVGALLLLLLVSVGALSAWNVARGARIAALEANVSALRLDVSRELADLRKTCKP